MQLIELVNKIWEEGICCKKKMKTMQILLPQVYYVKGLQEE